MAASSPSSTTKYNWPTTAYTPRHTSWPYTPSDFSRQDPSPDTAFYSSPRFVTHIDDAAIASLRAYYAAVLPREGTILDFCSSWVSHYPAAVEEAATASAAEGKRKGKGALLRVLGMGLNEAELRANPLFAPDRTVVQDLNASPGIYEALVERGLIGSDGDGEPGQLDASTNVVSTDYLTRPVEVLASLRRATRTGGRVHLTISNRCFPTKAVARWLEVGEQERLQMVGDFLHFAGWKKIEIVELSNGKVEPEADGGGSSAQQAGGFQGLMGWIGMGQQRDPLWVVRGVKE